MRVSRVGKLLANVSSRRGVNNIRTAGLRTLSPLVTNSLQDSDSEIFDIIEQEKKRLRESVNLIASENFAGQAVLEALGSVMQNKYSEGYPGQRYYGGNQFIDMAESACQRRALETYNLDPEEWGCNVQAHSGSPANFAVYTAVLEPHERMMALDLPHGGHLSHGYQTPTRKISAVSKYFECLPYQSDEQTGQIDMDMLEKNFAIYRPKLLITGASAYARHIDYARFKKLADSNKSLFMVDMAHISGLVAGGVYPSPFEYADIVTTTTHKSLRGPRGALIFYRKGLRSVDKKGNETHYELETAINNSVFPGHQGGPHNHTITAIAIALRQAQTPEFQEYQQQVMANSQSLANGLLNRGYNLVTGGTDNHLCLVDLRNKGIGGSKVETLLENANIVSNKNTVPGDVSALNPGGLRIGSPAMTTRGANEADFDEIAEFLHRGASLTADIQAQIGSKAASKFNAALKEGNSDVDALKADVREFARQFNTVGYSIDSMVYKE